MEVTKEQVLESVARAGISRAMLRSKSRLRPFTLARVAVASKLRDLGMSSNEIGRVLNRNHSSVLAMWRNMEDWLNQPKYHKMELKFIDDVLNGREVELFIPDTVLRQLKEEEQ